MNDFERIVDDYVRDHQHNAEREQRWFAVQPNLRAAIETAALAKSPSGQRHSHQRRIPSHVLAESSRRLVEKAAEIEVASKLEELYAVVAATIQPIRGIGELAVYDTALRIGAFLKLEPRMIFLHAGTRTGAKCLGLDTKREFLEVSALPEEFQILGPRELEDVLCIYKHRLKKGRPSAY